jgi:hypothetical protein
MRFARLNSQQRLTSTMIEILIGENWTKKNTGQKRSLSDMSEYSQMKDEKFTALENELFFSTDYV